MRLKYDITVIASEGFDRYGLTPKEIDKYWVNLGHLQEWVYIWPEPHGLVREGRKLLTAEMTRACAEAVGEPFVNTTVVEDPTEEMVVEICEGVRMCALKRENSAYGYHAFLPFMDKGKAVERFRRLRDMEEKIFGELGGQLTVFPKPLWFIQPYMPAFIYLGEVRALFINGSLYNTFITTPLEGDLANLQVTQGIATIRPCNLFE